MKHELVALLVCPRCGGDVSLVEVKEKDALRVYAGTLSCTACGRAYPVEKGIPRLLEAAADVRTVGRRLDFQWVSRWTGWFEGGDRCYGLDDRAYIAWMRDRLTALLPLGPGDRVLDAGCGSGEKTAGLAGLCPDQHVIGLDLGAGALAKAAVRFGHVPNLDYVQGNVPRPPLRPAAFRWGISIGMLHHTPDTRRAFARFRTLLADDAAVMLWIYRPSREAPEWRLLYFTRDVVYLGQSPKLPLALLRLLALGTAAASFPLGHFEWRRHARRLARDLPFFRPRQLTLWEGFHAQVFHLFDTLLPRYQFRHRRRDVERWLVEEGLEPAFHAHSYYLAGPPADR